MPHYRLNVSDDELHMIQRSFFAGRSLAGKAISFEERVPLQLLQTPNVVCRQPTSTPQTVRDVWFACAEYSN